ncbi:probable G-protein coupled receptor 139 isoform X1 [Euwallacea fornicatus]|uniref:probable G-protein coupled receptor 139 isoform X1 n=1 Tax=Euwallacea fornicatus TaxID=995702 RepID=UPI00338FAA96
MLRILPDNSSRHNFFDDVYDFKMNLSYNDSVDYIPMMGYMETCMNTINTFYTPFIIFIGFVGNILSFLVLSTTHLKMRSSSYYLAALAVSDFGFLMMVFVVYCSFNEIFDLFNREGFCQLFVYLTYVFGFLSVWLTVAFTTERFIAVRYPLRRQYICTVSRAKSIVCGIVVVALLSQIHYFWVAGLIFVHDDKKADCAVRQDYVLWGNITNCLDTFFTLIIPVILIVFMNIIIARVVFRSHNLGLQDEERFSSEGVRFYPVGSQSSNSTRNSDQECSTSSRRVKYDDCSLRRNRQTRSTSMQVQHNINKMLLLISSVFIALNFPSYVLRLAIYFGFTLWNKQAPEYLWCGQQFAMLLYYTNFSINFLLYAMCGKSFRICLKKMFLRGCDPFLEGLRRLWALFQGAFE